MVYISIRDILFSIPFEMNKCIKVPEGYTLLFAPKEYLLFQNQEKTESNHSNYKIIDKHPIRKKTPNAFLLFRRDYAGKMKEQYPKESNRGVSIKCGQLWNHASQEVKDNYILQAEKIKRNSTNPIRRKRNYEMDNITKKMENLKLNDKKDFDAENILHLITLFGLK